jgi:phage baseplate assembly protein W
MARIPHIAYPASIVNGRLATVEQGSPEDVSKCLYALLATRRGSREELPEYGIDDPTFDGFDLDEARAAADRYEPRAADVPFELEMEIDELTEVVRVG